MTVTLNKDAEKLLDELTALTGQSRHAALVGALRCELEQARVAQSRLTARQILAGAQRVRLKLKLPLPDHGQFYDEHGLPR